MSRPRPRIYYGYIIVAAIFIIMLVNFGLYFSIGVFFKPILNEFGWARGVTSGAVSLSWLMGGVIAIILGRINDKIGPRIIALSLRNLLRRRFSSNVRDEQRLAALRFLRDNDRHRVRHYDSSYVNYLQMVRTQKDGHDRYYPDRFRAGRDDRTSGSQLADYHRRMAAVLYHSRQH